MTHAPVNPRPQTTPLRPNLVHFRAPTGTPINGTALNTLRILLFAALGMAALLALLPAAGHDQLWFLLMGQRLLHGAIPYGPTNFDSNPPLVIWLSAIPVLLGEHLHLPASTPAKLIVTFAEILSAFLSLIFLQRLAPLSRAQITWLAFAFVVIFAVVPARDFGQRDHLTAILILPYVLAAATLRSAGKPGAPSFPAASTPERVAYRSIGATAPAQMLLSILTGLLAAIGICLKPHHALIPVAVELTLLILPRPADSPTISSRLRTLLRPEPLTIVLSGLVFLFAIHTFAPAYFTLALPTLRDTYWAIGHLTPLQLLAQSPQLHLLAALTLALFFRKPLPARHPATHLLLAAAVAATAAYYLQGTGWYYQQLPAISLFAAALALELLAFTPTRPTPAWAPKATAALGLVALALTTHFTGYPFTNDRAFNITSPDPTFFTSLPPNTPVAILTTSVDDTMMPTARYHLLWSQRTNNVWTLPAILRTKSPQGQPPRHHIPPDRLAALIAQQHRWMAEDLTHWHPRLILVARCQDPAVHCDELEDRHDNLLAWFEQDPAFREIWTHYHFLRTSGAYDAYTLTP